MNQYSKYTANVFLAKCEEKYEKGAVITLSDGAMFSVCLAEIVKSTEKVYWQTEI